MKKKFIISIIVCLIIIIGVFEFVVLNNRNVSTITLDINPSIKISLDKNEKVKGIIAINKDAKNIIDNKFKGKTLNELLYDITEKVIDNGYGENGQFDILLHVEGSIDESQVQTDIRNLFAERNMDANIIVISDITKEDEKLAKKYNISQAKANYINSILKDNKNIDLEDLVNKSVNDLNETKNTGNYCSDGYNLEGSFCLKEKERNPASTGDVCPKGYMDYKGKCYEETNGTEGENLVCAEEFELKDGKCIKVSSYKPVGDCANGEFISEENICKEQEYIGEGTEYCRDPGRTLYEHKCLATKPSINGGCLNNDMYYNGKCLNPRDDYYMSEWKCPDGAYTLKDDNSGKCYKDKKTTRPTYTCDDGFTLENNICVRTKIVNPEKEIICPTGYTKVDFNRCINMNNTRDFETGFVCGMKDARVINDTCVIYEITNAKY